MSSVGLTRHIEALWQATDMDELLSTIGHQHLHTVELLMVLLTVRIGDDQNPYKTINICIYGEARI